MVSPRDGLGRSNPGAALLAAMITRQASSAAMVPDLEGPRGCTGRGGCALEPWLAQLRIEPWVGGELS